MSAVFGPRSIPASLDHFLSKIHLILNVLLDYGKRKKNLFSVIGLNKYVITVEALISNRSIILVIIRFQEAAVCTGNSLDLCPVPQP